MIIYPVQTEQREIRNPNYKVNPVNPSSNYQETRYSRASPKEDNKGTLIDILA